MEELTKKYDFIIRKNEEQEVNDLRFSKSATSRHRTLNFNGVEALQGSEDFYLQLDNKNQTVGLQNRICNFVRLYSSFINAGRKFLLAHNKYVSTFNLIKDRWVKHKKFEEGQVRQIFRNRLVLTEKEKIS